MRRALTYARDFGAVIAHETEDSDLAAGGVMNEGSMQAGSALPAFRARPKPSRWSATLRSARLTGGAYHAAKISAAASAARIARAKADGARSRPASRSTISRSMTTMSASTAPSFGWRRRCAPKTTGWR